MIDELDEYDLKAFSTHLIPATFSNT
jgi:hypothetical protein